MQIRFLGWYIAGPTHWLIPLLTFMQQLIAIMQPHKWITENAVLRSETILCSWKHPINSHMILHASITTGGILQHYSILVLCNTLLTSYYGLFNGLPLSHIVDKSKRPPCCCWRQCWGFPIGCNTEIFPASIGYTLYRWRLITMLSTILVVCLSHN